MISQTLKQTAARRMLGLLAAMMLFALGVSAQERTTIEMTDEVVVDDVMRLGINTGGDNYWDSSITKIRVAENFEGVMYRMISWGPELDENGVAVWFSPPKNAWDAMKGKVRYTLLSPPNEGVQGVLKDITTKKIRDGREITYLVFDKPVKPSDHSKNGLLLEYEDFSQGSIRETNNKAFWNTAANTAHIGDVPPGSFGQAALWLKTSEGQNGIYTFVPMWGSQGDPNGTWHVHLWAKKKTADGDFRIAISGAPTAILPVSDEWQKFEQSFEVKGEGDDTRLNIQLTVTQGEVLVDDVLIWKEENSRNPTPFRDPFVDLIKELNPGTLRILQMGGSNFANNVKPPLEQMGWTWDFSNMVSGGRNNTSGYKFNMHDYFLLCEYVGANPWYCLPGTIHVEEMEAVMEYLAGPADQGYGKVRADLGHPRPWTEVFDKIYVEFGNEAWNPGGHYAIGSFNGPGHWQSLIAAGRKSPQMKDNIVFVAGSQAASPGVTSGLLRDVPNADTYAIAPYMMNGITQEQVDHFKTLPELIEWAFAYAVRRVMEPQGNVYQQWELTRNVDKGLSIYEHNFHWTNPRPGSQGAPATELRNDFQASLGAGLAVINDALLMLRERDVQPQAQFNLSQTAYSGIKLWGFVPGLHHKNQRYRPHFLAQKIANSVMGGQMVATRHSGANPVFSATGVFEDTRRSKDLVTYDKIPTLWTYAFSEGNRRALIVFNLGIRDAHAIQLRFPGAVAGKKAHAWLLTAGEITANNEPETPEPQVKIVEQEIDTFENGYQTTLPPFSMVAYEWTVE